MRRGLGFCFRLSRSSVLLGPMPKRKISTSPNGSVPTVASTAPSLSSRRSARAVPRKSYAQEELMHDPDVFEDPLDRAASPDQSSELSGPDSDFDVADHLSEPESEPMSQGSPEPDVSAPTKKNTPAKRTVGSKPSAKAKQTATAAAAAIEEQETKKSPAKKRKGPFVKSEAAEPELNSDGEPIEEKGPTKASKHRERDARAAERYADFAERDPTFDSDQLPLPFKGRLGYACLNTILRSRKEPVFCSRTTRIATIAKEDKGMPFLLELGRQNAADLSKMIEWNEKYGIRFFRLSSEMFPFASHPDYLYNLEHADAELRAAGALANKYDHRITCHPGQFTQIASPNPKVFDNAVRDLEFHNELLSRMKLEPEQRDRDAVLILHLGGAYGDKPATLDRFRANYAKLSDAVRRRLVLENDDMSWSVTDLLPLCQELSIPLVLDWHHHNIVRDETKFREGSLDILPLLPAIAETWSRKGIKQKMHISEARLPNHPLPSQRRSHSARVYHLPPCADDMDIMIEAKDKEQAVFELSKAYNLNRPPLPAEVVGDGPGAKGDEAYWPEGQESRLKTTKTRVKKEVEVDSEGEEIKPPPKKKTKQKTQVKVEDDADPAVDSPPKKSTKKKSSKASEPEQDTPAAEAPAVGRKRTQRKKRAPAVADQEGVVQEAEDQSEQKIKVEDPESTEAAPEIELQTGITAKQIVDKAYESLQAEQQLASTKTPVRRSTRAR